MALVIHIVLHTKRDCNLSLYCTHFRIATANISSKVVNNPSYRILYYTPQIMHVLDCIMLCRRGTGINFTDMFELRLGKWLGKWLHRQMSIGYILSGMYLLWRRFYYIGVDDRVWMSNYIPLFYVDRIVFLCLNLPAGLANPVGKKMSNFIYEYHQTCLRATDEILTLW